MKKITLLTGCLVLAACNGNYAEISKQYREDFSNGNYEVAAEKMAKATVLNQEPNNVYLGGLQCGNAYLWANNAEGLETCFSPINSILKGETDEDSSYKIKSYEKIMFKTYEGIGLIANDDSYAKQVFNQVYDLQKENISENSDEIAKEQEKFKEDQKILKEFGINVPSLDSITDSISKDVSSLDDDITAMKDYANPYTTWLMALYDGASGDYSNANNGMSRVAKFAPKNTFVKSDVAGLKKGSVYVVFENGMVGQLQKRSLVPDVLKPLTQPLSALGVEAGIELTIPDVFPGTKALETISVKSGDTTVTTQQLVNVDSVVKTDYNKYKTRNIISSVAFEIGKIAAATAAGYAANEAAKDTPFRAAATAAAVTGVMSVKKPWDLRSWDSIPTEIQTARVNMPVDRKLFINDGLEVVIPEGIENAIVFVRIPTANAVPAIVVGKLN